MLQEPLNTSERLETPRLPGRTVTVRKTAKRNSYDEPLYRVHVGPGVDPMGYQLPGGWLSKLYTVEQLKKWQCERVTS